MDMGPYTAEVRLCDDNGMVSDERVRGGSPGTTLDPKLTYRQLLNNLRGHTGLAPYTGDPFTCTGSAHLAREHFRCTNPRHMRSTVKLPDWDGEGMSITPDLPGSMEA